MKRKLVVSVLFLCFVLSSCNNGEIKKLNEKVDSLKTANIKLQKELDNYKYSPAKVLANINQNYTDIAIDYLRI